MVGFAEILAEVETAVRSASAKAASTLRFESEISRVHDVQANEPDRPLRGVAAAYRQSVEDASRPAQSESAQSARPLNEFAACFPTELAAARRSPEKLTALRRRIAWALHPDRTLYAPHEAAQVMASFNAMIDTALTHCRTRRS